MDVDLGKLGSGRRAAGLADGAGGREGLVFGEFPVALVGDVPKNRVFRGACRDHDHVPVHELEARRWDVALEHQRAQIDGDRLITAPQDHHLGEGRFLRRPACATAWVIPHPAWISSGPWACTSPIR